MAIDRQESPYRRGNRYDQLPIPMVAEHCIPVDAGAVQLVVESRRLTNEILADTFHDLHADVPSTISAPRSMCAERPTGSSTCGSTASRTSRTTTTSTRQPARTRSCASTSWRSATPSTSRSPASSTTSPTCCATAVSAGLADEVAGQPDTVSAAIGEVRDRMQKVHDPA